MLKFTLFLSFMVLVSACQPSETERPQQTYDEAIWSPVTVSVDEEAEVIEPIPDEFLAFNLNYAELRARILEAEEMEGVDPEIELPMPDSTWVKLTLRDSGVMSESLRERYPEIRSFRGRSDAHPQLSASVDMNDTGLQVMITGAEETVIIGQYLIGENRYYLSFYRSAYPYDPQELHPPLPPDYEEEP